MGSDNYVRDSLRQNERETNKLAGWAVLAADLMVLVFSVLGLAGIVDIGAGWIPYIALGVSVVLLALIAVLKITTFEKKKYIIMLGIVLFGGIVYLIFPLYSDFLFVVPIILSVRYYDRRLTVVVMILTCVMLFTGVALNLHWDATNEAIHEYHTVQGEIIWRYPQSTWIYVAGLKTFTILLAGLVGVKAADGGRKLLIAQAETMEKKHSMETELLAASKIQLGSMPGEQMVFYHGTVNVKAGIRSAKEVGGDFYDYFMVNEDLLALIIADISDKGLQAAMFEMKVQSLLRFAICDEVEKNGSNASLGRAVTAVNRQLARNNPQELFATAWIACIDCRTGVGRYVNAGHDYPLIRHSDRTLQYIQNEPQSFLGLFEDIEYKDSLIRLEKDDMLFLYTDGVTDARNEADEAFGKNNLEHAVLSADGGNRTVETLKEDLAAYIGSCDQFDDITLMTAEFTGERTAPQTIRVKAETAGLRNLTETMEADLKAIGCPEDVRRSIETAVDEIGSNICDYAYEEEDTTDVNSAAVGEYPDGSAGAGVSDGSLKGMIKVVYEAGCNYFRAEFHDSGMPFDPLQVEEPDLSGEPCLGGLGIFLTRNLMDDMDYRYENGENILTVTKVWGI